MTLTFPPGYFFSARMAKFLGVLTIEAFAASALGMVIGAIAKDEDAALALGPALMTVFILFSGTCTQLFHVTAGSLPHVPSASSLPVLVIFFLLVLFLPEVFLLLTTPRNKSTSMYS